MSSTESDPRVFDAVHRWFELPKLELSEADRGYKFIVSPEGDAGVVVELREERRFACIDTRPYQGYPPLVQPSSTAPDVAVVLGTVRFPLVYYGDSRIIGALETPSDALLLVNLGIQVALVIVTFTDPVQFMVVWTGAGSQVPELASPPPIPLDLPPSAPAPVSPAVSRSLPPDSGAAPHTTPTTTTSTPPAASPSAAPPSAPDPPRPQVTRPAHDRSAIPASPPGRAPTVEPKPPDRPSTSASTPAPVDESGPAMAGLSPIVLSEEVTAMLIRHLRHAATLLPVAKGAEVARQWLLALERACGDMSGIGDVVGGSRVLFAVFHASGHLAAMPSTVSASAAAKLLIVVTPLVEQVGRRRWALRVSALLDPQSAILRKLARRAPATCRLATNAPPPPATTGGVRKPGTVRPARNPARKNRTAELAAQLVAANAELERLRADIAELRQAVVSPGRDPKAETSTGTAWDDEPSA